MSELTTLYEKLLTGESVTLATTPESFKSIYGSLRTIKQRYDKKYEELTGDKLSQGKVIQYKVISPGVYSFSLAASKPRSSITFRILSTKEITTLNAQVSASVEPD